MTAQPFFLVLSQPAPTVPEQQNVLALAVRDSLARIPHVRAELVQWNIEEGQLEFAGSAAPARARPVRFGDRLMPGSAFWLVFTGVGADNDVLARAVSQCREYGVRLAAVLGEAAPEAVQRELRLESLRADVVIEVRPGEDAAALARRLAGDCAAAVAQRRERRVLAERRFAELLSHRGVARHAVGAMEWNAVRIEAGAADGPPPAWPVADRARGTRGAGVVLLGEPAAIEALPAPVLEGVFRADVLGMGSPATLAAVVRAADRLGFEGLLPARVVQEADATRLVEATATAMADAAEETLGCLEVSARERELGAAASRLAAPEALGATELAVVVSTYNRAAFVEMNVRWLLALATPLGRRVRVVVLDNASTDDTEARLASFCSDPRFTYLRNAVNVGMLGNLQKCSALALSRYVWLIGDDDYVIPGALERVLEVAARAPRVPLMAHNFTIYRRERVLAGDAPQKYLAEMKPIAPPELVPVPTPTGVRRVNEMAAEHDNLFTAVYPLVFRSDVLAATFNYPFDGVPFDTLVECVPTSKLILERLRYSDMYWFAEHGIVGNIHNSWAHHRPRWHLVNMAQVFELARTAGVDEARLWRWARWHVDLFVESVDIARRRDATIHLEPHDAAAAFRIYRAPIDLPRDVRLWTRPT